MDADKSESRMQVGRPPATETANGHAVARRGGRYHLHSRAYTHTHACTGPRNREVILTFCASQHLSDFMAGLQADSKGTRVPLLCLLMSGAKCSSSRPAEAERLLASCGSCFFRLYREKLATSQTWHAGLFEEFVFAVWRGRA